MRHDRFGLPLSLVEALEADGSPDAALLAGFLTLGALARPPVSDPRRPSGPLAAARHTDRKA